MGTLYIISTPIGNLDDITFRALKTLFSVHVIACEDTRRTGALLEKLRQNFVIPSEAEERTEQSEGARLLDRRGVKRKATEHLNSGMRSLHYGRDDNNKPQLLSYYEQNEAQRIPEIINLLQSGINVALVSDAGTPLLSDPGFKLVRECIRNKIKVEAIPGVSSPVTALTVSGLPTDKFMFLGYPPRKPGHRMTFYRNIKKSLESINATVILFEAPHKIVKTLKEMQEVFGDREIVLARELTKIHEEVKYETITHALDRFKKREPKGEFVLLFHL